MNTLTELQQHKYKVTHQASDTFAARSKQVIEGATTHIYMGYGLPGSNEGESVWRIKRVSLFSDESSSTMWADGNADFDNIWSNAVSLSYS